MADFNLSPNMSLPVPVVGIASAPLWATLIDVCLNALDAHDHTPGNGVQITPAAMDINTNLSMVNHSLTSIQSLVLTAQSSVTTAGAVYEKGVDLYYRDGNGIEIAITASGGIAAAPGNIAGLVPPASATYSSGTFIWQSNAGIAADMDFGSAVFRNTSPNSTFGVIVKPPAGLSSSYSITLPVLPSAPAHLMSISPSGVISTSPNTVITADIADQNVTTAKIADANITNIKMAANSVDTPNIIDSSVTIVKQGPALVNGVAFSNTIPGGAGFIGVATFVITAPKADRPILVYISANGAGGGATIPTNSTMTVRILRDGATNILQYTMGMAGLSFPTGNFRFPLAISQPDSVTAGAHSYTLQVSLDIGTGFVDGVLAANQL